MKARLIKIASVVLLVALVLSLAGCAAPVAEIPPAQKVELDNYYMRVHAWPAVVSYRVTAVAENVTDSRLSHIKALVLFYDAEGETLKSVTVVLPSLGPGETAPFGAFMFLTPDVEAASFGVKVISAD